MADRTTNEPDDWARVEVWHPVLRKHIKLLVKKPPDVPMVALAQVRPGTARLQRDGYESNTMRSL